MRPAAAKSDTVPWFSKTKSSAGSWFDSRNRMIDVPVATPCLKLSIRNAGCPVCASPNWSLKMSTQLGPHDGVAALATPAVSPTPAPPTNVSEAAAANTLLFRDIWKVPPWPQPHPARELLGDQARTVDLTGIAIGRGQSPGIDPVASGGLSVWAESVDSAQT